jgi:hypothetical protein
MPIILEDDEGNIPLGGTEQIGASNDDMAGPENAHNSYATKQEKEAANEIGSDGEVPGLSGKTQTKSNASLGVDFPATGEDRNTEPKKETQHKDKNPSLSQFELFARMRTIQKNAKRSYFQATAENSPQDDRNGQEGGDSTGLSKRARIDAPKTTETDIMADNFSGLDDEGYEVAATFKKARRTYRKTEKNGSGSIIRTLNGRNW